MGGPEGDLAEKKKKTGQAREREIESVRCEIRLLFLSNSAALKTRKLSVVGQKEGEKEVDGGKKEEGEMWPHRFTVMCAVTPG